jgi:hypothetical protein
MKVSMVEAVFVATSGNCTACSLSAFQPSKLQVPKDLPVVLVFATAEKNIPADYGKLPVNFRVVADPNRKVFGLTMRPNQGQSFLVSDSGVVTWAASRPNEWPKGVTYAHESS